MLYKTWNLITLLLSMSGVPLALGVNIPVVVGGPGILQFSPSFVNATPGDNIIFSFRQKNHTATQSSFENPCQMQPGGFDTGFIPVASDDTEGPFPAARFTVTDINPVWVYCRQANHCQQGMVFAINPGDKFPAFQAAAMGNPTSTNVPPSTAPPSGTSTATTSQLTGPSVSVPPSLVTVTATVTVSGQTVTTTYASYPGSAAPTSVTTSNHIITVGGPNKLVFSPSNISAQIGDTVTFQFMQKNHTATQSSFQQPCLSLTKTSTSGQVGFDSGFMPVADNTTNFPTFTIRINDTAPVWAYCKQANHCGQGMVFSVNAVESGPNNFAAFQARAMQLNGTSSGSSTSAAPSTSATNGAGRFLTNGFSGLAMFILAAAFGSML